MRNAGLMRCGVAVLFVLAASGCGGGGGGVTPAPSNVSVTISPTSATVGYGGTKQFSATVTGATNTSVTWKVTSTSSSDSSQIGSISTSGLYTAPSETPIPAASSPPQTFSVIAGQPTSNINVTVPAISAVDSVTVTATSQADPSKSASATVTLSGVSILAVGQCVPDPTKPGTLNCTGGSTGTEVQAGQTATLFVAGFGILPGTSYTISGSDVVVTQPAPQQFQPASDGTPAVYFTIVVSPGAVPGPRNLVVRNQGNELASFAGAVQIQ
ncbi:MAG TPA: hypothetical protein VFC10_19840 [Terriglobia bacterium]|nr:hypothetical protein [Terriglobia bacterium]